MSKLAGTAKSSKSKEDLKQDQSFGGKEKLVKQLKPKEHPRSYRLDSETMNTLKNTLDRVNESSPKKVSEARLVKALIYLSKEIDEEKIIKALKEVW